MVRGSNEAEQEFFDAFAEWLAEYGHFDTWAQECDEYRSTLQSGVVDYSTMSDLSQWASDVLDQLKPANRELRKVFALKANIYKTRSSKAGRTSDPRYLEDNMKYLSGELNKLADRGEHPDNWGIDALEYILTLLKDVIKAADSFESSKSRSRSELKIPKRLLKSEKPQRKVQKSKDNDQTALRGQIVNLWNELGQLHDEITVGAGSDELYNYDLRVDDSANWSMLEDSNYQQIARDAREYASKIDELAKLIAKLDFNAIDELDSLSNG